MVRNIRSSITHMIYRIPIIGIRFRRCIESMRGKADYQSSAYWNESLQGWAAEYTGGTLQVDLRDSITVVMARHLAPDATSILDLGCGGGTLALALDRKFEIYGGVDISDVAIERARVNLANLGGKSLEIELTVSELEGFETSRSYDVIVFNEVLYYLTLDQVTDTIRRYSPLLKPGGLILVSLKDHELSRFVLEVVMQHLDSAGGVLYQQQARSPRWKTVRNPEAPAFLVQAFRLRS